MKNKTYGYIALAIGLIVFNVIALVIPVEHTSSFWTAYGFTDVALIVQLVIWNREFKNADELSDKFLGIPIAYVGVLYLIAQIICFATIVASKAPTWVSIVASVAILGASCIFIISGEISRSTVGKVELKVNDDTVFLRDLRIKIDSLIVDEKDSTIKAKLQELVEVAQFSSRKSKSKAVNIENNIMAILDKKMTAGDIDYIISLLKKREIVIKNQV